MIFVATLFRALLGNVLIVPWTVFVSVTVIGLGALGRNDQVTYWMSLWSKVVLWFYGVDVVHLMFGGDQGQPSCMCLRYSAV